MLFTSGYARWGALSGAPVRWHWSLLAGCALAGGLTLNPLAWLLYLGIVAAHEAANFVAVRQARLEVVGVDFQATGGKVRWRGDASPRTQVILAWSGVLAQLGVLIGAELVLVIAGGTVEPWLAEVERVSVELNAILIAVNLLPLPTFDGEVAWKAIHLLGGRPIPERRAFIIHLAEAVDPRTEASREAEVEVDAPGHAAARLLVEAELAALTKAHNDKADCDSSPTTS
jgi:hypothetical protein